MYVAAERNSVFRERLRAFIANATTLCASTLVVHELLVGSSTKAAQAAVRRAVLQPFQRHLRVIETTSADWAEAAAIVRAFMEPGGYSAALRNANLRHDILLAASCRRVGATLITANLKDFAAINAVRGFRFVGAFPEI